MSDLNRARNLQPCVNEMIVVQQGEVVEFNDKLHSLPPQLFQGESPSRSKTGTLARPVNVMQVSQRTDKRHVPKALALPHSGSTPLRLNKELRQSCRYMQALAVPRLRGLMLVTCSE